MSEYNTTQEQEEWQLCNQALEKERLANSIRDSRRSDYGTAKTLGVAALVSSAVAVYTGLDGMFSFTIANGAFALTSIGILVHKGRTIVDKNKQIERAEGELKQIRENPLYRDLGLVDLVE